MKNIALFSVIALSALMVGCTSTQTRDCDGNTDCNPALCADAANCDPANCDPSDCKPADCDESKKCPTEAKACPSEAKACPTGAKAACGDDCTKPCCEA